MDLEKMNAQETAPEDEDNTIVIEDGDTPGEAPEETEEACTEEACTEEAGAAGEEAEEAEEVPQEAEPEKAEEAGREPEEAASPVEEEQVKSRPSFFKRKKDDKLQKQVDELTDKLKRNLAEFDNFRKRTEKEKSSMYVIGARDVIEKILPVVDNFERGLAQAQEGDAFADGMKMIYKQLMTALEELGVKPIEAVGREFNPDLHNAVMHVEDETVGDNIVVEEFQKGYTYKDFVVRHSMVKVAN